MNPPQEERRGTILLHDVSLLARGADPPRPDVITPARLADSMLVSPLLRRATLVLLEPEGDLSTLSLLRGTATFATLRVPSDVGSAAVARLAAIVGLDPLADARTLAGNVNVGRITLRTGADVAEVLVTVGASARGLGAEVRPVSVNGRDADLRAPSPLQRCAQCGALQAGTEPTCEVDGGPLIDVEDDPTPGGTIGVYRVVAPLGEGGGGAVFAGEHALLGRPVAIKLLHRTLAENPALARRFLSEARAASRLRHPNVVDVTDFGVLPQGNPYMVMERLDGESLAREARARGRAGADGRAPRGRARWPSPSRRRTTAGIAHNDLKPANVIMLEGSTDAAPRLKLIDFGAASVVGTSEELLFGTPGYMPPERDLRRAERRPRRPLRPRPDALRDARRRRALRRPRASRRCCSRTCPRRCLPCRARSRVLPQAVLRLVSRAAAKKADERQQTAARDAGRNRPGARRPRARGLPAVAPVTRRDRRPGHHVLFVDDEPALLRAIARVAATARRSRCSPPRARPTRSRSSGNGRWTSWSPTSTCPG